MMQDDHQKRKKNSWVHRMGSKFLLSCLPMLSVSLLTGCFPVKEDVQLSSKEEVLSWCQENYGEAEVVGWEEGEDLITYTVKDLEKGFTYQVVSKVTAIVFDTLLGYKESTSSNFDSAYYAHFLTSQHKALEKLQKNYGAVLSTVYPFELTVTNENQGKQAAEEVLALKEAYDTRNHFGDLSIQLMMNGEPWGNVSAENDYTSPEEEEISYMMNMAAQEMGVERGKITYLRWESVLRKDLEGLDETELAHILGTENDTSSTAKIYYFRFQKREYFISDIILMTSGMKMRHFGDYPRRD